MSRWIRPFTVLAFASAATALAGFQVASIAAPTPFELMPRGVDHGMVLSGYDIRNLKILEPTLYHVEESYVEPGRIDWEAMFVSGLEAVERKVPAFLFHRDLPNRRVSLEIGEYRRVMEVQRIGSSRHLQSELRVIVGLMKLHLQPDDIPTDHPALPDGPGPFAEVEYALVNGVLSTLDPHTMLLPPPDANEMDVENQGEFGGLGITVIEEDDRLVVDFPTPGTPAHLAGIRRQDVILRIDGQSTINMSLDEAVHLLRGPVGGAIQLEIQREGQEKAMVVDLQRQIIKLHEVKGALLDGDIGLVSVESFHKHVEQELHEVLARLKRESRQGLRGVVLDLRGNPGGYLNQAVGVADTFLTEGDIVSTVDGYGNKRDLERAHDDERTEEPYPVVVLLDSNSASASEVVAGALRNNERAVIIGERSFGKGTVQSLHNFYDDSKLKLTISKYLTPGERSIQAVGIPADIALMPVRVGRGEDDDALVIRMYWRERVHREADLDHALERMALSDDASAFKLAFLDVPDEDADPYLLNLKDYQVGFAADLIRSSTSSRRADILAGAARIVDVHARRGDAAIVAALKAEGIDWADGRAYQGVLPVRVALDVQGGIEAGKRKEVRLHLTNTSDKPLHRVGVLASEHGVLGGREFLFGHIAAGATATASVWVYLVDGYPTIGAPVSLSIRDTGGEIGELQEDVQVFGRALPSYAWTWKLESATLAVGQRVAIRLDLKNVGGGISGDAAARIRNRSGKELDIVTGTLRPGSLRTLDGESCPEEDRTSGCQLRLLAGESWTGRFEVDLKGDTAPWELELSLSDEEAYDHASIVDAGFYELYEHLETLRLEPGAPAVRHQPPRIHVSRAPSSIETADRVSISGWVEDDVGLSHVLVFAKGNKVFAQASIGGLRSIPFTADVELEPGENTLTVVAEDIEGFTSTRSVVTYLRDPEKVTRAAAPADD